MPDCMIVWRGEHVSACDMAWHHGTHGELLQCKLSYNAPGEHGRMRAGPSISRCICMCNSMMHELGSLNMVISL